MARMAPKSIEMEFDLAEDGDAYPKMEKVKYVREDIAVDLLERVNELARENATLWRQLESDPDGDV